MLCSDAAAAKPAVSAHADFGEAVTAAIVPESIDSPPDADTIIAAAKQVLASYKVPKQVHFLDALPRNSMGKVQKNILRDRYG